MIWPHEVLADIQTSSVVSAQGRAGVASWRRFADLVNWTAAPQPATGDYNMLKILSGDIGGTTTRLALFDMAAGSGSLLEQRAYSSADYASLSEILTDFSTHADTACAAACFGVAGPVSAGRSRITNLPWTIDARELEAQFGWPRVGLINDLEAIAWGIEALEEQDFCVLNAGQAKAGNQAVIAAGTGLGQAGRIWDGRRHQPLACEGGHTDFAPVGATETALRDWLAERYGHVSWERERHAL